MGVQTQLIPRILHSDDETNQFGTSTGGTRTRATEHHDGCRDPKRSAPPYVITICTLIATRGEYARHMEQSRPKGALIGGRHLRRQHVAWVFHQHNIKDNDKHQRENTIPMKLLIDTENLPLPYARHKIQGEVNASQEHENGGHILQVGRVEVGEISLMRTETTRTDRRHSMADRIVERHRADEVEEYTDCGQDSIYQENTSCGLLRLRTQLAHGDAGRLRREKLGVIPIVGWKQSDREQHDT